jgi:hypothetical protein
VTSPGDLQGRGLEQPLHFFLPLFMKCIEPAFCELRPDWLLGTSDAESCLVPPALRPWGTPPGADKALYLPDGFAATSARIRVRSSGTFACFAAVTLEAAGYSPSWGSTGPKTAWASMYNRGSLEELEGATVQSPRLCVANEPLRTTSPGRRLRVLKAGGDSNLIPSADVDLVDSGKGSFVHCVGDPFAVGRVGRIGTLRDFILTSPADADRIDR